MAEELNVSEESPSKINEKPGKQKRTIRRTVIILTVAVLLIVAWYALSRWLEYEKLLDQEARVVFYGNVTFYTPGKNDEGEYWIYLDCDFYNSRISISPSTHFMSEEVKERLEAHEDYLPVIITSIFITRDQVNATKNGGRFTYPAYSIDLWK